ncbi:hypothetical protein SZ25_00292, partial [Candidatus Arcanobacter lacustris]
MPSKASFEIYKEFNFRLMSLALISSFKEFLVLLTLGMITFFIKSAPDRMVVFWLVFSLELGNSEGDGDCIAAEIVVGDGGGEKE